MTPASPSNSTAAPGLPPAADDAAHQPVLDGLRGLAILLVLWHGQTLLPAPFDAGGDGRLGAWIDLLAARLGQAAWIGLDLLFVLSGFLVTRSLLGAKGREHFFRGFYARRALRLLPLYYLFLAVAFLVLPSLGDPRAAELARFDGAPAMYWLHLQNLAIARADAFAGGLLDPTWALAIGVQFYLLWPVYVFLLDRWALRWLALILIAGAVAFRTLSGMDPMALFVLSPARMDALAVGALVATFDRDEESLAGLEWLTTIARPIGYGGLGVLVVCGLLLGGLSWSEPMMQGVGYTILALGFGGVLVLTLTAPDRARAKRLVACPPLRFLGRHSLALFLFHVPVALLVSESLYGPADFHAWEGSHLPGQVLFHLLATGLTVAAALAAWFVVEKPCFALQRRLRPGGAGPAPVVRVRRTAAAEEAPEHGSDVFELAEHAGHEGPPSAPPARRAG